MGKIKADETDQQQGERGGHGTMNTHGADPHDGGVQGPDHQEKTNIRVAERVYFEMIQHPDDTQGDPESAVRDKCAVSEIVAAFELLKTGDQLSHPAEGKGKRQDRTDAAPSKIVELEDQRC
jgi:hypothetical protein